MTATVRAITAVLAAAAGIIAVIGEATTAAVTRWQEILTSAAVIVAALISALGNTGSQDEHSGESQTGGVQ